ncbi:uncharacterized protein V6R79_005553 [Siganus canaliculatus]
MEIGALFKEMRASRCCRCGPVRRQCQLVSAHCLVELAAGIIKLQTGSRPGEPPRGETARSSACQQLIRATLTPATALRPHAIQTAYPHTGSHTSSSYPSSGQASKQAPQDKLMTTTVRGTHLHK